MARPAPVLPPTPTNPASPSMAPDAAPPRRSHDPSSLKGETKDAHHQHHHRERSGRGERRSKQPTAAAPSSPRYGSPLPATSAAAPSPPTAHARPSSPAGPSRHSHGHPHGSGNSGRRHPRSAAPGGDFDRSMPLKRTAPAGGDYDRSLPLLKPAAVPTTTSAAPPPRQYPSARGDPGRQLFDPRLHDPLRFVSPRGAATAPSVAGTSSTATTAPSILHSVASGSVSTGLSSIHDPSSGKDKGERGDKERERRKRREGSERKSQRGDRADDDTRSRSSEGSESLKDRGRGKGGDTGVLGSLREQYRGIQALEAHLVDLHRRMGRDETIVLGTGATLGPGMADGGWVELCSRHMKLAHAHHDFLTASLDPRLPASLHSLPVKYNIAARLWQNSFHLLIERMRTTWLAPSSALTRSTPAATIAGGNSPMTANVDGSATSDAAAASARALEHLTDYILDAYQFYTTLLDEQVLSTFRSAWIEALGDLARYRMAVANHVAQSSSSASSSMDDASPARYARIDDEEADDVTPAPPVPSGNSIGKEVADAWDVEDRETWRTTARDWYALGVGEKPGEGRLHHRLALISRDVKGEEERALYHFVKSLITNNPFSASRESILPLFDTALQSRRHHPDASAADLFVLLHGMLFTKIELDAFDDVFARFFERLQEDRVGTRPLGPTEWVMMGVINLAACLQYGAEDGLLKRAANEDAGARRPMRRDGVNAAAGAGAGGLPSDTPQAIMVHAGKRLSDPDGSDEGSDDIPVAAMPALEEGDIRPLQKPTTTSVADEEALPLPFRHALRLSFSILSFCLAHPVRRDSLGRTVVNPYITIFLTFLSTIAKQPAALALVERAVPWTSLVAFFNTIPRKVEVRLDVAPKITVGGPLPEDWCLRGMEWVGRRVYERGFWKQKASSSSGRSYSGMPDGPRSGDQAAIACEMDVLSQQVEQLSVEQQLHEGIVDDTDGAEAADLAARRWRRIAWGLGVLVKSVPGFAVDPEVGGGRKVRVAPLGPLQLKIDGWAAERAAMVEEMRARMRQHEAARDAADELDDDTADDESEDEQDEQDPEMKALKAQRRQLRAILRAGRRADKPSGPPLNVSAGFNGRPAPRRHPARAPIPASALPSALSGYTVLVFDTNVILSCLALFRSVVESAFWTVMVPLPVITELDGLSKQPAPLGTQAQEALQFLTTRIRSHGRSLKVQTSRGNYLADLAIRSEDISFSFSNAYNPEKARNMDDLILRACTFQAERFVDRTAILGVSRDVAADVKDSAAKVVLLTNDRNLRLRAKAQGVMAVDEKPMRKMLGLAKDGTPLATPAPMAAGGG